MDHNRTKWRYVFGGMATAVAWTLAFGSAPAQLIDAGPKELEAVGVTEQLDAQIPLDLPFVDSDGSPVTLKKVFDGTRPVIMTMNYSDCPMLCSLQLNGLLEAIRGVPWNLGDEYRVVTVGIDPLETPERAQLTKQKYLKLYGRAGSAAGWSFLTTRNEANIKQVADTVGFGYRYEPETKQYAHAAVLMICTPEGRVSKYLYGVNYDPQTLRFSLLEAGEGKIGTTVDQILLYCFHYDPERGRYGPAAFNLMRLGGLLTLVLFGGILSLYWFRESRKRRNLPPEAAP